MKNTKRKGDAMRWTWMQLDNGESGFYLNGDHDSWRVWEAWGYPREWLVQLPRYGYFCEDELREIFKAGPNHGEIEKAKWDKVGLAHAYPSADAAKEAVEQLVREEAEAERERLEALAVLDDLAERR